MTYQGIKLTHSSADRLPAWSKSSIRKTAYNLVAVFAVMVAAGVISSAYHPSYSSLPNRTFESMGVKQVPTIFRGAPPAR